MNKTITAVISLVVPMVAYSTDNTTTNDSKANESISNTLSKENTFSIPSSPVAAMLGDTNTAITRPQSVQSLAVELGRYVENGKESPGISLTLSPGLMFGGKKITNKAYNESYFLRQITRMEFSAGLTEKSNSANNARRAALGLTFTLLDDADPAMSQALKDCFSSVLSEVQNLPPPPTPGASTPGFNDAVAKVPACLKNAAIDQRAANSLKLGIAKGWVSRNNVNQTGWENGGWGLWLAGQYSLGNAEASALPPRLLGRLQLLDSKKANTSTGLWQTTREADVALQLRIGIPGWSDADALAEIGYTKSYDSVKSPRRISFGFEKLLAPNWWILITATTRTNTEPNESRSSILGNIKYNFTNSPLLSTH